jgi:putative LysE/RhtB family amino acid efflux pump
MDTEMVWRGFVLGLAIAAPVGAIGTLVIRRSASAGMLAGLSTGMGAAVADAIYASISAFGVSAGANAVASSKAFHVVAAAILFWLGVATIRAQPGPAHSSERLGATAHARAFGSTITLTLANPSTIASFAAAQAAIGVGATTHPHSAVAFTSGVFAGSTAWWCLLSAGVSVLGARLGPRGLHAIQVVAGAALLGFGVVALIER